MTLSLAAATIQPVMTMDFFARAQDFIWKNARLLDRQLFQVLFQGAPPSAVTAALTPYQNPDGGFGQALEPDLRAPDSQPVTTEFAFNLLELTGALADVRVQQTVVRPACDFLQSVTTTAGGVPFTLASANRYAHAPWMEAPDGPPVANINPTARLAALLLKHGIDPPWLAGAMDFCRQTISRSETVQFHDVILMVSYLQHDPDPSWSRPELERVIERVRQPGVVTMDPGAGGYVKMPLDWAPTPESIFRPLFEDAAIERHLDALVARQCPDGGWPITWPPQSAAAEMECRGCVTIDALRTLRAYGRIPSA